MKMPWGKFEGKEIHELPSWYLLWLAENCNNEAICCEADEEWQWREKHSQHRD